MIFYGVPNMLVTTKQANKLTDSFINKPLFRFNENGEYETEDELMIKRLKGRFDCLNNVKKQEEEEVQQDIEEILTNLKPKENENPEDLITVAEIKEIKIEVEPTEKELRLRAKELKVPSYHNMGLDKLRLYIIKKEAELKDEHDRTKCK